MELFTVLHKEVPKKSSTLQFFVRPAIFKYHTDTIGEIWIEYFFWALSFRNLVLIIKKIKFLYIYIYIYIFWEQKKIMQMFQTEGYFVKKILF